MYSVITGGCGFIGSRLSKMLVELDHRVTVVDNLSPQIHGEIPSFVAVDGVEYRRVDIRDIDSISTCLEECDSVFHLAAETGTGQSMYSSNKYTDVNVMGTSALIEAIGRCVTRPKKIVLASSRSVYGEGAYVDNDSGKTVPVLPRSLAQLKDNRWSIVDSKNRAMSPCGTPEDFALAPASIYAATKLAQEFLLFSASEALGSQLVTLRFQNVYGEGQALNNPYTGLLSIFFNRGRQGLDLPLYEDGLTARDFIHVEDVVNALILAAKADLKNGELLNVGSGQPSTVTEVAEKIISIGEFNCKSFVSGKYRAGDIRCCYADMTRAMRVLGFEAQVSLDEGLSRLIEWGASQPVFEDRSSVAERELVERGLGN